MTSSWKRGQAVGPESMKLNGGTVKRIGVAGKAGRAGASGPVQRST